MSGRRKRKEAVFPAKQEKKQCVKGEKDVIEDEAREGAKDSEVVKEECEETTNDDYIAPTGHALFASRVLLIIQNIPKGKVTSYGKVASLAFCPNHSRLVGRLLKEGICANGRGPWQRVLGASGAISLPPLSGGNLQRDILEQEGGNFNERTRRIAQSFWWDPSSETIKQLLI